jgi:hypothetical protein
MKVTGYDTLRRTVRLEGDGMAVEQRPPNWPDWLEDVFTAEGIRLLNMAYDHAKRNSHLDRANRVSAEDLATSAVGCFIVAGRTDLLRRIP